MEMPFDFCQKTKSCGLVKDDSHCRRLMKLKKLYLVPICL